MRVALPASLSVRACVRVGQISVCVWGGGGGGGRGVYVSVLNMATMYRQLETCSTLC